MTILSFIFAKPFLNLMNVGEELLAACMAYLQIALFSLPLVAMIQISAGIMRGVGNTKTPMLISLVVNLINVLGCWLFIYGNLGFPAMGIRGAAVVHYLVRAWGRFWLYRQCFLLFRLAVRKEDIARCFFPMSKTSCELVFKLAGDLFWKFASIVMTVSSDLWYIA